MSGPRADRPPGEEILVAEGLEVRYGGTPAADVERLALREGELLAVLGPNGAGKSTLLRCLAGLERPDAGAVRYRGRTGTDAERALREDSAAVLQRPHLWSGDVEYNLRLGLRLRGVRGEEADRAVGKAARALGIDGLRGRDPSGLSAGEAQRVAVARALATDPDVLFLDEPTANLDDAARRRLRRDLDRAVRSRPRTTLLVTHDRREAFYLADRVAVMKEGRLLQVGTPAELYANPADDFIARATGAEHGLPGRVAGREGPLLSVEADGGELLAVGEAAPDAGPGDRVRLAYRPEDVALSEPDGKGGERRARRDSVRNARAATVRELREVAGLVRVRLEGPPELVAVVTRASADRLELAPGKRVVARIKASALHAFPV